MVNCAGSLIIVEVDGKLCWFLDIMEVDGKLCWFLDYYGS